MYEVAFVVCFGQLLASPKDGCASSRSYRHFATLRYGSARRCIHAITTRLAYEYMYIQTHVMIIAPTIHLYHLRENMRMAYVHSTIVHNIPAKCTRYLCFAFANQYLLFVYHYRTWNCDLC